MKVMFSKAVYAEMEKAFGKKDLSKLRKEIITDKNGHRKTVYKKIDKPEEGKNKGAAAPKCCKNTVRNIIKRRGKTLLRPYYRRPHCI